MPVDSYWTRRRLSRRAAMRAAGVGAAGVAAAALVGCGAEEEDASPTPAGTVAPTPAAAAATTAPVADDAIARGGTYRYFETGDPTSLDPYGGIDHATKGFASSFYSRLYMRDTQPYPFPGNATTLKGDLAESAEVADDGLTWIVKLREGARFHDIAPVSGREVTVEDVQLSWDRLRSDAAAGSEFVRFVDRMEVVDDRTLRFVTVEPAPQFLETLADGAVLYIIPVEYDGGFNPKTTVIGSGPWVLESYRPSEAVNRSAHTQWHQLSEHDGLPLPLVDRWEAPIIPEYQTRLAQFETGQLYGFAPNTDDILGVRERNADLAWTSSYGNPSFIYFDHVMTTDQPWRDERVRQAVSRAMDRAALMELQYNLEALQAAGFETNEAWNNLIPCGETLWWLDPQSEAQGPSAIFFQYDPADAKRLLDAAGFGDGFDVEYRYSPRYGTAFMTVAEAQHAMMQQIGIRPTTVTEDYNSVYITHTFRGEFTGMAFGPQTGFAEVGNYPQRYFTDNPVNHSKVNDPVLLDLTKRQALTFDADERRELLHEIQRVNATHMYYVPMQAYGGSTYTAWHPWARGYRQSKGYGAQADTQPYFWIDPERMNT